MRGKLGKNFFTATPRNERNKILFYLHFLKHNEASHEGRNSIKSCRRKLYHQDKGKSLIFVMYNFIQFGDITFYKTHTLNEMIFFLVKSNHY